MKVLKCTGRKEVCNKCDLPEKDVDELIAVLKAGELIVFPTDTLYGIGADPFKESSVKKVFIAKNRPFDMPLSIAVSNEKMMESVAVLNEKARAVIRMYMPGPITIMLAKKPSIPDILTSGSNLVGIRIPDHPLAIRLIDRFGPITATSANLHSQKDPVDASISKKDLKDHIKICVDCGKTKYAAPSTIVDVSDGEVDVIRKGVIPQEEIENALR
ncbi:MAG: threonylcarbamoyl-AMP synthase [Thermoplasmata archaeon]|nr:threonylcarbamoyl-AMP synthase [Thermoplasmata archaeon]TFG69814.1 MAG: threonylcarbamoyl-AMP synthase [Methanomassiliicoccus sp.]